MLAAAELVGAVVDGRFEERAGGTLVVLGERSVGEAVRLQLWRVQGR